jgi:hypothetical protein
VPENAATPTSRVHAVLGALTEGKTHCLKKRDTTDLAKLLHELLTLANTKKNTTYQNAGKVNLCLMKKRLCQREQLNLLETLTEENKAIGIAMITLPSN